MGAPVAGRTVAINFMGIMKIETPRTDAVEDALHISAESRYKSMARHARELEAENAKLRNDIECLQQYHIAGRDMNDSVERFIENGDRLGDSHEVVKSRIEQMRRDLPKWQEANEYAKTHGRKA